MDRISLAKNRLVSYLGKDPSMFTRADIVDFIENNGIEMVNFMYPAEDGRLKTLNFVINNKDYLLNILSTGERVDGSSLFSFIEPGNSDLYVLPRYSTAFVDPFAEIPTVAMLCSFFDKEGKPLASSPEHTLRKACRELYEATGLDFEAMGELEYYVISPDTGLFPARDQKGYHESAPYAKFNDFRTRCMSYIAQTGGQIKYGHSEVGNFTLHGMVYEQNEIEFLPVPAPEAADQLMLAKWVIRNLASRMGYNITFAPKITTGKAGSGLHIHMRLMRDGRNIMLDSERKLSAEARRMIAGLMELAPAITAFGNRNPTSYFRLVPHQEAPTSICWGDRNRSVLVRVPLGWTTPADMSALANPLEKPVANSGHEKQTVEIRSADGSADIYLLIAAIAVAARRGLTNPDAEKIAEQTYVDVNIHDEKQTGRTLHLAQLPASCAQSAEKLGELRSAFEELGVFSPQIIDGTITALKAFDDANLSTEARNNHWLMSDLVARHFHCG